MARQLRHEDYTVGWACALPVELAVAEEMLDEEHDTPEYDAHDTNIYTCRKISEHNVVIACRDQAWRRRGQQAARSAQRIGAVRLWEGHFKWVQANRVTQLAANDTP
jgi:hypothetical protein